MIVVGWIVAYIISSLFWKWILSWGGADCLEGWQSIFFLSFFAGNWDAEQIKFYALLMWIVQTIGLVLKLIFM